MAWNVTHAEAKAIYERLHSPHSEWFKVRWNERALAWWDDYRAAYPGWREAGAIETYEAYRI